MTYESSSNTQIDPDVIAKSILKLPSRNLVGVPDSTLHPFLSLISGRTDFSNIIATNECEAISIAAGQFIASQIPSIVYLQNSGLGKIVHPVTTLLHAEVCGLPSILLIGWRGAPDIQDEPQHKVMGRKIFDILKALDIEYKILSPDASLIEKNFEEAYHYTLKKRHPFALIVHPNLMRKNTSKDSFATEALLNRTISINHLVNHLHNYAFISTTGKISRELYDARALDISKKLDFYNVGAMGCASSIALGIALGLKQKKQNIAILDGDGALLMQMGSLATITSNYSSNSEVNFLHFVLDNSCHDSTGGQPTVSKKIDLSAVAKACGYKSIYKVSDESELTKTLALIEKNVQQPSFIHILIRPGDTQSLSRPKESPRENVDDFIIKLAR